MLALTLMALCATTTSLAHHSYAMFDKRKSVAIEGSIAKVEWTNPHCFVWVYVKKPDKPGAYDLYAFESDTPNQLKLNGWSKDSLKAGDKVSVRYFPLREDRPASHPGGFLVWVERSDGTVLKGDKDSVFGRVAAEDARLAKEKAALQAAPQPGSGK